MSVPTDSIEFRFPNLHAMLEPAGTRMRIAEIRYTCAELSPMSRHAFGAGLECGPKHWDPATREDVVIVTGPTLAIQRLAEYLADLDADARGLPEAPAPKLKENH